MLKDDDLTRNYVKLLKTDVSKFEEFLKKYDVTHTAAYEYKDDNIHVLFRYFCKKWIYDKSLKFLKDSHIEFEEFQSPEY